MLLEIKKVRNLKNNAYGVFTIIGHEKARISISLKRNKFLVDYAATLLHELLHAYITLLQAEGFKLSSKKEHFWIDACEGAIIRLMYNILRRKRHGTNSRSRS